MLARYSLDKEQNKLIIAEEKIVLTNCVKS